MVDLKKVLVSLTISGMVLAGILVATQTPRYTQVQWTSASWHLAHLTVQYLSEPT